MRKSCGFLRTWVWGVLVAVLMGFVPSVLALPVQDAEPEEVAPEMDEGQEELRGMLELYRRGEIDPAVKLAEDYVAVHPESAAAREVLGIGRIYQGQIEAGLGELRKAVELNPRQATALTKIGDVYLARGEREKAKREFLNAVAVAPGLRHAHQRLGGIYEDEDEIARAILHYELGLQGASVNYVGIKVNLGNLYNRLEDFARTVELLGPVVPLELKNPAAHQVLGAALIGLGESEKALKHFKALETSGGDPEQAHLAVGVAYRQAGKLDEALESLAKALEEKPGWAPAEVQTAVTLEAAGKRGEAIAHYRAALEQGEDRAYLRRKLATALAADGKLEDALAIFREGAGKGETDVASYETWAALLQGQRRLEEAEKVYAEAVEKFPESSTAHFRLGMHLALTRRYDEALATLKRATELSEWDPRIAKATSLVYFRRGELDAAITEARRLLKLVPWSHADRFYLATLLEQAEDYDGAAGEYEAILEKEEKHVGALNNLAQLRMRTGAMEEALALAKSAYDQQPGSAPVLDTYGWALHKSGESAEAAKLLVKAVEVSQGAKPGYLYHLASVRKEQGEKGKAVEHLKAALALPGEFAERAEAEALLKELE